MREAAFSQSSADQSWVMPGLLLGRKCACGQHTIGGGECDGCKRKSPATQRATGESSIVTDAMSFPGHPIRATGAPGQTSPEHDLSVVPVHKEKSSLNRPRGTSRIDSPDRYGINQVHLNGLGDDDPIHRPIIEDFRRREGLPLSGVDEFGNRVGPSDAEIKYGGLRGASGPQAPSSTTAPATTRPGPTPCPTSVRVGTVVQRNHGDLSAAEKEQWGTWLGAMSQMIVGPGPDHTGHCMKERLTTVSNNCPAAVYSRGGSGSQPCTGDRCLDINRYGSSWGVSDGPTAFLDMHRTRFRTSLLEGTGVTSCSVVCEQTYSCDRTHPTTGTFRITRNFQASSHTRTDGTTMHVTTGTVTKT